MHLYFNEIAVQMLVLQAPVTAGALLWRCFCIAFAMQSRLGANRWLCQLMGGADALWDFLGYAALNTGEENDSDGRMTDEEMTLKPEPMH
jgi:hypothetical protein